MNKRVHRVGSITFGLTLIVTGILYIASLVFGVIRPETVMRFWPTVLIALGLEVLVSAAGHRDFVYDKAAIVLTCTMLLFSMILGCISAALSGGACR